MITNSLLAAIAIALAIIMAQLTYRYAEMRRDFLDFAEMIADAIEENQNVKSRIED